MINLLKKIIPKHIIKMLRWGYCFILDITDSISGRRNEFVPPRIKIFVGAGDYLKIGEEFFKYFIEFAELKPNQKILDVGCGSGRMALPLTKYLASDGAYEGFDIVKEGIQWCLKITKKYPNFNFHLADIYNKSYNPEGRYKSSEYVFPYKDNTFDFIFLTSVFTHMFPDDIERYFSEISRVLKIDGKCLFTFFLLNVESLNLIRNEKSSLNFKYEFKNYSTIDKEVQEEAIALNEDIIRRYYKKYGYNIIQPVYYGGWCGRDKFLSYQDIVIANKK
jgi:ubiquinone/menaquinone biosynthesis C-methylase UbiE